ncbi:MAG: hypothetical protein AAGA31_05925 [Bacteroidota bacterium]
MPEVYKLLLDTRRPGDTEYDAVILPNGESNKWRYYFLNPHLYPESLLPAEVSFLANFQYLHDRDCLFTDSGLFVVRKRLVDLFTSIDGLKYLKVPCLMIDDTYFGERYDECNELHAEVPVNKAFYALRFSSVGNYFDPVNSVFRPMRSNPNMPGRIKRLFLKAPKEGFPPIFRTQEQISSLFVTRVVKDLIEKNKIKGCYFEEVEVTEETSTNES